MADFKIGDRVEAGWCPAQEKSAWSGPKGTVTGIDGTYPSSPHYLVKWANGYEAWFPRVELRLLRGVSRRFNDHPVSSEPTPLPLEAAA